MADHFYTHMAGKKNENRKKFLSYTCILRTTYLPSPPPLITFFPVSPSAVTLKHRTGSSWHGYNVVAHSKSLPGVTNDHTSIMPLSDATNTLSSLYLKKYELIYIILNIITNHLISAIPSVAVTLYMSTLGTCW